MKKILIITAVMLFGAVSANAAGTLAGTSVDNNATLSYTVGGVTQTQEQSNVDNFVVDKKIDFTLTNDDTDQIVTTPGATKVITTWTLTNLSNATQRFTLADIDLSGSSIYGDADTKDTGTRTVEISTDGGTTWVSYAAFDLAYAATGDPDVAIKIRIKSDIPLTYVNGDVMNIQLEATAVKAGGVTAEVVTGGAGGVDRQDIQDVVLAEGSGVTATGNTQFDGKYSAWGGYIIESPTLSLTKSSCVFKDLVSGVSANAKRIPGATITYMLDIENTSDTVDASDINLTDVLSTNLDPATVTAVKTFDNQTSCTCTGGTAGGGTAATSTVTGQTVKITGLTVLKEKHNCVTFQVDIK